MRCYLVASAEYGTTIPVLDDGSGPTEYGRDVLIVWARNATRAKVTALRVWRRQHRRTWCKPDYLYPSENPWRGMTAERYDRETPEDVQCPQCNAIFTAEDSMRDGGSCNTCGTWLYVDRQPDGTYKAWSGR